MKVVIAVGALVWALLGRDKKAAPKASEPEKVPAAPEPVLDIEIGEAVVRSGGDYAIVGGVAKPRNETALTAFKSLQAALNRQIAAPGREPPIVLAVDGEIGARTVSRFRSVVDDNATVDSTARAALRDAAGDVIDILRSRGLLR